MPRFGTLIKAFGVDMNPAFTTFYDLNDILMVLLIFFKKISYCLPNLVPGILVTICLLISLLLIGIALLACYINSLGHEYDNLISSFLFFLL